MKMKKKWKIGDLKKNIWYINCKPFKDAHV